MGKQAKEIKVSIVVTFIFIIIVIIIKGFAIDIAIKYSNESNQCASNYNGYLDACSTNADCLTGYICSTDNKCYCNQNNNNILDNSNNVSCSSNSQCLNGQVCSIANNECVYTVTCEEESQKVPGMSLSTWLLSWSIVGLCFCVICLIPLWLEKICCQYSSNDCLSGSCVCLTYCLGGLYAVFSLIWTIMGFIFLFGPFHDCKEIAPTLWYYSLFNCIILFVFIFINPITFEFARDSWCKNIF